MYTSPLTMTGLHSLDLSRITDCLCSHEPMDNTVVFSYITIDPREKRTNLTISCFPCHSPTQSVKPITVIKQLVSIPLNDYGT